MSDEIRGLDEYQARCIWTAKDQMSQRDTHMSWSLAIAGEAGELANLTKKVFVHGHAYDQERVVDELGDIRSDTTARASASSSKPRSGCSSPRPPLRFRNLQREVEIGRASCRERV